MKTDRFDRQDVFTIATIEDARKYINCEGYFFDSFYKDLHKWRKGILKEVNEYSTDYPFIELNTKGGLSIGFRFFLPVDKVRKEKKWRAFNSNEFSKLFKVGDVLTIKYPELGEIKTLLTSIRENANQITLGGFNDECFETLFSDGVQILLNGE